VLRNILGVVVGLVVGSVANMALVQLNLTLFPMPDGADMNDPVAFAAYVQSLPATAFLLVFAAHCAQAGVGGWVAARIGASRPLVLAGIVGGLTVVGAILNLVMLSPPAWTWAELPLIVGAAWAAGALERKRKSGQ
jgi:hypothetical protein